ncbi:MAG: FtsQ-type POTRA domain-containing protein [Candidatus Eremiobacteraeota bacterium]|nr:FtsQ-type POTRA domain-containing protein [Candidatus Eremiobacteraeota bacterium]
MSQPKRDARRSASRRSNWRGVLTLMTALALLAALLYAGLRVSHDPRFNVVVGPISGLGHTGRGDVLQALALRPDQNAWLLNRRASAARVERLPWVKTAHVSIRWPNVLHVALSERQPVASVVLAAGNGEEPLPRYALIDPSQRVLTLARVREPQAGLPLLLITPAPNAAVQPGDALDNKSVGQALEALSRLKALGLQVSEVAIAPATGISARADRDLRVLFGDDEDLAKKAAVFQAIVAKISQPAHIAYIDVRSVRAPTVLYR